VEVVSHHQHLLLLLLVLHLLLVTESLDRCIIVRVQGYLLLP
jgi:hypothetical protein